jgi:hypothetical protein
VANEVFSLIIKVFDDGSTTLTGPLDNKTLCYGLLESAKDKVREFSDGKEKQKPAQAPKLDFNIGNSLAERKP